MKPGPKPKSRCPKDIHFTPCEDHKQILNQMGSGGISSKIQFLIECEGKRQMPQDRQLLKAKWIILRNEARERVALTMKAREKMIEAGYTESEIRSFEEEGND